MVHVRVGVGCIVMLYIVGDIELLMEMVERDVEVLGVVMWC